MVLYLIWNQMSINFMWFMRLWTVQKSKDSLKSCFENVNISICSWMSKLFEKLARKELND